MIRIVVNIVSTAPALTGEVTSSGVWYILFQRTPYTLTSNAVGKGPYSVHVNFWAPFINSGQGFHDANWCSNWASNAYLTDGSSGCVNILPNLTKTVFDNLTFYQPVVVY